MTERIEPSADAVKLVDAIGRTACRVGSLSDYRAARASAAHVVARTTLLDYIAAKDAEIEWLRAQLAEVAVSIEWLRAQLAEIAVNTEWLRAQLAAKDTEIERLTKELAEWQETYTDEQGSVWRRPTAQAYCAVCQSYLRVSDRLAKAELARLEAAHVPKVLRRLSEAASLMDDGPVSWTKFCVAAGRWVRSLLAAQPAQDTDAVALLREIEWARFNPDTEGDECLFCTNDTDKGHTPDCRLAKIFKQTGDA